MATTNKNASITVGSLPVLTLDRATGQAEIQNVVGDPLTITGYSINSELGLLNPPGWTSLADQQVEGWREANPRPQTIAELNPLSQSTFEVGQILDLGKAYNGGATNPRDEDVTFEFSIPDGSILQGFVEYTGPSNDLVLRVDPESGEAAIQNLSQFTAPFDVTGYRILSGSTALSVEGWTSFSDSGAVGEGWVEANPKGSALAELNLSDSHSFDNGTVVNIGSIFTPGSLRDLEFEFANLAGEFHLGTVEYGELGGIVLPGDCNGDGVVNAADLPCVSTIDERDIVLASIPTLAGDLDGNGDVAFPDFLVLSANFGQDLPSYTDGNIDLDGGVAFPDFLILSANFGQVPAGGAAMAAVPEPASVVLLLIGSLWFVRCRRRPC